MYVYIQSEPSLYTVGFYKPDGKWEPDSDHSTRVSATERVHYLNGGVGYHSVFEEMSANIEKHRAFLEWLEKDYHKD